MLSSTLLFARGAALPLLSVASGGSFLRPVTGPLSSPSTDYTPFDSSFQLVWSDEFNQTDGSPPDPSIWNLEVSGNGEGNHELEYYTTSINNSYVQDGRLHIVGRQEQYKGHNYTSARIDSAGKVEVLYGLIAARARITMYDGYWPAFWLIGSQSSRVNWPRCGEMDIMEQVNGRGTGTSQDDNLQFGTLHYNQHGINSSDVNHQMTGGIVQQKKNHYWGDEFHLYQALWTNTTYTFMVDDLAYEQIDLTSQEAYNSFRDPTNPFFFIINLALGGDFPHYTPTDGFPATFVLDWVRVWQQNDGQSYVRAPKTRSATSQAVGSERVVKPLQWVDEERRVTEGEATTLQAKKVRDTSRYKGYKQQEGVKTVKTE